MTYDPETPRPAPAPLLPPGAQPPWSQRDAGWADEPEIEFHPMEYVLLVWAHKWVVLGVLAAVVLLGAAWSLTRPKMYRAEAMVTLYPAPQLSQNQLDMMMNWWQMDRFIADQVQVLQTHDLAQRVVDQLGLDSHPEFAGGSAADALLARIDAEPIRDSFVIKLSMIGRDPDVVSEWLNLYIREYVASNIEASLERTKDVYEVIQTRLDPLRSKLTTSEQALMGFQESQEDLLFADQSKNVINEQIDTLTSEYAEAKAERIRLETKLNALRRLRAANLSEAGFTEILNDPMIQSLRQQRNEIEVELAEKLGTLKEGHPQIQELRSRLAGVDERIGEQITAIRTSIQTDYDIVSGRERSLFEAIQQLKDQSIDLSKQRLEYDRLKRDYEQNKVFLEDMLARSNEADISQTKVVNNVRIIERARPPSGPFSPNLQRTLVLSTFLGLFLGVGLVLFIDYLDHTLRTPEQVERYLGLEVLSTLPKFSEDTARVLRESFQALRTALILAARKEGCQVVMVTSAAPAEGKTTVAYNLAKVLATGGARVLMIDADLRKPRIHRIVKGKNVRGLTSVVLGEREMSEVVLAVPEVPNLSVVTSGPLPPNPPELFGKSSFRRMLDSARESYDWVVIDTPPVSSVTDPVMCARVVDMLLLVVQYAGPKRETVRECLRQLGRTGVRVAGVLLNKIDLERDSYYYYYYTGYYSYTHYGDDVPEKKSRRKAKQRAG